MAKCSEIFPSAREAPASVLAALREIVPSVELVWLRRGAWALFTYAPDARRQGEACRALEFLMGPGLVGGYARSRDAFISAARAHGDKVAMTRLKAYGYLHQQTFDMRRHSEPAVFDVMINWLRCAAWVRQHEYEAAWRALEAAQIENEGEQARIDNLTDHARLKEAYRMQFRRPVSESVGKRIDPVWKESA